MEPSKNSLLKSQGSKPSEPKPGMSRSARRWAKLGAVLLVPLSVAVALQVKKRMEREPQSGPPSEKLVAKEPVAPRAPAVRRHGKLENPEAAVAMLEESAAATPVAPTPEAPASAPRAQTARPPRPRQLAKTTLRPDCAQSLDLFEAVAKARIHDNQEAMRLADLAVADPCLERQKPFLYRVAVNAACEEGQADRVRAYYEQGKGYSTNLPSLCPRVLGT